MARKALTDEERQLLEDMQSRADLTEDEEDEDDGEEVLIIRGNAVKDVLSHFGISKEGEVKETEGEGEKKPKKEKEAPKLENDPKPPVRHRYFG